MKEKVMNGLEKFSKAMLSPLSYISAAGLILVLGALLTSTSLSAMIPVLQWTPIKLLGQLIYNCIMVIINNLSLMFCVGISIGCDTSVLKSFRKVNPRLMLLPVMTTFREMSAVLESLGSPVTVKMKD